MSEYVSKEELKEFFESIEITVAGRTRAEAIGEVLQAIYNGVMELPTTDAEPVRHGKWIIWDEIIAGIYHTVSECSKCGFTTDKMSREEMLYCPNCGCRMDEE
jgi:hypothetical protein